MDERWGGEKRIKQNKWVHFIYPVTSTETVVISRQTIKGINYVIYLIINHLRATHIWSVAVKVLTINDMSIPHPISFA